MKERDYLRKRQQLEEQYQADLAALDRVWAMFHSEPPPAQTTPSRRVGAIVNSESDIAATSKRNIVRGAIRTFVDQEFMSKDVRAKLDAQAPEVSAVISENQLSSIISRLAGMGELVTTRIKIGRTPAMYRLRVIHPEAKAS